MVTARTRYLQALGQGCHRQAGIVAKKRDKPPIRVVHRPLYNMQNYPDDLPYP